MVKYNLSFLDEKNIYHMETNLNMFQFMALRLKMMLNGFEYDFEQGRD